MRMANSLRGSAGIGWSSKTARWPRCSPFASQQRHAQVTLDPPLHQRLVVGELGPYSGRVMAQVPPNHVLAGSADHVPLDVVGDPVPKPKRQRAHQRPAGELGDEGVARSDRGCQVADERLKERLCRYYGRSPRQARARRQGHRLEGESGSRRRVVHQAAPQRVTAASSKGPCLSCGSRRAVSKVMKYAPPQPVATLYRMRKTSCPQGEREGKFEMLSH